MAPPSVGPLVHSQMSLNYPDFVRKVTRFLNLCENDSGSPDTDYRTIYRYKDGNDKRRQITLGRGFTEDGGSLRKVVARYVQKGGKSKVLANNLEKIGKGVLVTNTEFITALRDASAEQEMKDAQDEIFREVYLDPAVDWATRQGFTEPTSIAVVVDSYLHSGQMTPKLVQSFAEHTPKNGGSEHKWMQSYCEARLAWFTRVTTILHTCMFRPRFFLGLMNAGNWSFDCPLKVPEKGSIC